MENLTTAATTTFCAERLDGPGGHIWIDGNSKITAGNGSFRNPRPNAFSLVQIADCPGATEVCRGLCYVHNLEQYASDTHALYAHNSTMIRQILADEGTAHDWAERLGQWIETNCEGGFRWHVSGDVINAEYARFITEVCEHSPSVTHWMFTRSLFAISALSTVENLTVNMSLDRDNYDRGWFHRLNARTCYLTTDGVLPDDLPDDSVIFPDYRLRGETDEGKAWFTSLPPRYKSMVCPVDMWGKTEKRRCGPCSKCLRK